MNRRSFFKGLVGATTAIIVPDLILPERQIWALGGVQGFNAPPRRLPGDDTAWVNWHITNDLVPPPGRYDMHGPLRIANKHGMTISGEGVKLNFHGSIRSYIEFEDAEDCAIQDWAMDGKRANVQYLMYAMMPESPDPLRYIA